MLLLVFLYLNSLCVNQRGFYTIMIERFLGWKLEIIMKYFSFVAVENTQGSKDLIKIGQTVNN